MMNKRRECLQLQKDEILRDPQAKYSGEWQVIGICGQAILPFLKTPGRLWWSYMLVITSCVQVSGDLLVATLWLISGNKCHFHYQSHPHGKWLKETKFKRSTIICNDTTTVTCCALEKGWDIITQDPYKSPEIVELDEVLYVLDC